MNKKEKVEDLYKQFNDILIKNIKFYTDNFYGTLGKIQKDCDHNFVYCFGLSSGSDKIICENCLFETCGNNENYKNYPRRYANIDEPSISAKRYLDTYEIENMIEGNN